VSKVIAACQMRAQQILAKNKAEFEWLRDELVKRGTLEIKELTQRFPNVKVVEADEDGETSATKDDTPKAKKEEASGNGDSAPPTVAAKTKRGGGKKKASETSKAE